MSQVICTISQKGWFKIVTLLLVTAPVLFLLSPYAHRTRERKLRKFLLLSSLPSTTKYIYAHKRRETRETFKTHRCYCSLEYGSTRYSARAYISLEYNVEYTALATRNFIILLKYLTFRREKEICNSTFRAICRSCSVLRLHQLCRFFFTASLNVCVILC